MVELELVAAGLLERVRDAAGRETVRVSEAGVQLLAVSLQRNRTARGAHEALVGRVAREMQRAGRVVWRGLSLRAAVADALRADERRWALAMPDLFSIRHTSVEDYAEPIVHEIKVSRADLLSDLRRPAKGQAYLALAGQCWYVLRDGIAQAQEVPEAFGVMFAAGEGGLTVARPAPRRPMRLAFATWMALARANAEPALDEEAQRALGEESGGSPPCDPSADPGTAHIASGPRAGPPDDLR